MGQWSIAGSPGHVSFGGSYPSDASGAPSPSPIAWTLRVDRATQGVSLTAFVECLSSSAGASTQVVTQTATVTTGGLYRVEARCPSGTLRTGGGFQTTLNLDPSELGFNSSNFSTVDGAFPYLTAQWVVHGHADVGTLSRGVYATLTVTSSAVCLALPGARLTALSSAPLAVPPSPCGYPSNGQPCVAGGQANSAADCTQQHAPLLVGGGFSDLQPAGQPGATVTLFGAAVAGDDSRWLAQVRTAEQVAAGQQGGAATGFVYAICMIGPG